MLEAAAPAGCQALPANTVLRQGYLSLDLADAFLKILKASYCDKL